MKPSLARGNGVQQVVLGGDGRAVMHADSLYLLGQGSQFDSGEGWIYAKRNVPETDWVVVGRQSDAAIKAETLRSVWPVLGALGLSWLAALAISILLARRLSRPISEISRGVEAFAAGRLEARVQVQDQGEIGRLAEQFNRMADVVQRSQEELEGLVAVRTQDLAQANDQLAAWSKELEQRVADKLREVERLSELKRFFSPRLAESLVAEDRAQLLQSHRREATVMFVDLRGFTAFAEAAPADRVMAVLREFHAEAGRLIFEFEGTLERFTGDGMMVFFNDPDPMPDHAGRAVALACRLRDRAAALMQSWQAEGAGPSGVGIGLSLGQATIGPIGFESRVDYAAIGTVTNRAARLCAEAAAGEVLICSALHERLQGRLHLAGIRQAQLKGLQAPETCYAVAAIDAAPADPLLTNAPAEAG
ncbi:adenylate/guanylate cyclase domain-containing protein [Ideonella alba]|uniref:HAMP domain-containing protein n=1 Tax=Ideonella alba TaxID=2824118 RepID=A0A941BGM7_9BURK|nr:adenylate/guanylate cyclase domain-containing protein [Ideonella alba]MBQ0933181.1 HAMP domain-containing protein [Ideonella alba]